MSINATLIGQMITFTLLVWLTMQYVWPPLLAILEERKKRIAQGLAAAEAGEKSVVAAEAKAKQLLDNAKAESGDIIALAQKRSSEMVSDAKNTAKLEGDKILQTAQAQIAQQSQIAARQLRQSVCSLAITASEQILQEEIDQAKHQKLLAKVAAQLG